MLTVLLETRGIYKTFFDIFGKLLSVLYELYHLCVDDQMLNYTIEFGLSIFEVSIE